MTESPTSPWVRSTPMRSPIFRRSAAMVIALALCGTAVSCGAEDSQVTGTATTVSSEPGSSNTPEQFTPAVMQVMSLPRWFTGSDGRVHLVYEVQLINGFPIAATVTGVEVLDADGGGVLASLDENGVTSAMSLLVGGAGPTDTLEPSTVGVLWMDVEFDDVRDIPERVEHRVTVSVPPGLPVPESITYDGAEADVDRTGPISIGPPLAGAGWMAVGSCCDGPHRRTAQPIDNSLWVAQRFAIDFNRLGDGNLLVGGDPTENADWFTYDQPVLAVADAEVVEVANDFQDQSLTAPRPVTIEEADGNHVILKLSDDVYAFYAHLRPGSVAVAVGDKVTTGQEIGRTGNSGSSTGPHLHFQLMNQPSALVADGLPYVFDEFVLTGDGPALDQLMALDPAVDAVPVDPSDEGVRKDELPMSKTVVEFGGA